MTELEGVDRSDNSIVDRLVGIRLCRTHDNPPDQRSSRQANWRCPYCEIERVREVIKDLAEWTEVLNDGRPKPSILVRVAIANAREAMHNPEVSVDDMEVSFHD